MAAVFDVHHEAGHAVIATVLVRRSGARHGVTTMVRVGCPRAQRNEAIIALAGPTAEDRCHGYSASERAELWDALWRDDLTNALRNLDGAEVESCSASSAAARARELERDRTCGVGLTGTRGAYRRRGRPR